MSNNGFLMISSEGELYLRESNLDIYKETFQKSSDRIRSLDLRNNSLNLIPVYICELKNLTTLDLRENSLEIIPESIRNLVNLEVLKLDHNHLTILPSQIFDIDNLKSLSFGHNSLLLLDRAIGNLDKLTLLDISYNQIQVLPRSMSKLRHLCTLYMHSNEFSKLPPILHMFLNLRFFSLEWLRYTQPSLPITLKGTNGEILIKSLQNLSLLHFQSSKKHDITVIQFLRHFTELPFFSLDKCISNGISLLHKAVLNNDFGVIKGLIESSCDLNLLDPEGYSALVLAIRENNLQTARLLLESGCNVNIGGGIYGSALHLAIAKNDSFLVSQLIKAGSKMDLQNCDGNSPLHILMINFKKSKHTSEVIGEMLLKSGAQTNSHNNDNWGPIHIAARKAQNAAVVWIKKINTSAEFKDSKFDVNFTGGKQDWTALHLAAHSGLFKTTKILLKAGADVFSRNKLGKTPRDVAKGNLSLFKFLSTIEKAYLREFVKRANNEKIQITEDDGIYKKLYEDFKKRNIEGIKETVGKIEKNDLNALAESDAVYLIGRMMERNPKGYLKKIAKNGGSELSVYEAFAGLRDIKVFENKIISPKNIIGPRVSLSSQISKIRRKDSIIPDD